jgi:hypothetical protein
VVPKSTTSVGAGVTQNPGWDGESYSDPHSPYLDAQRMYGNPNNSSPISVDTGRSRLSLGNNTLRCPSGRAREVLIKVPGGNAPDFTASSPSAYKNSNNDDRNDNTGNNDIGDGPSVLSGLVVKDDVDSAVLHHHKRPSQPNSRPASRSSRKSSYGDQSSSNKMSSHAPPPLNIPIGLHRDQLNSPYLQKRLLPTSTRSNASLRASTPVTPTSSNTKQVVAAKVVLGNGSTKFGTDTFLHRKKMGVEGSKGELPAGWGARFDILTGMLSGVIFNLDSVYKFVSRQMTVLLITSLLCFFFKHKKGELVTRFNNTKTSEGQTNTHQGQKRK